MKKLYIIKAGSTYASTIACLGDFDDWIAAGLGVDPERIVVVDAVGGAPLPAADDMAGAVVTGSHAMVTDNLPWSLGLEAWIAGLVAAGTPFLGICYGHQLLGRAAGGQVGYHPAGREVGTVEVRLTAAARQDPLFRALPDRFAAHATHAQSVLLLPDGAELLAGNDFEPVHAFRVGGCAWGVQFHPEYAAEVMRGYIEAQRKGLERDGRDVGRLLGAVQETPEARRVLRNFASLADRAD